MWAAFAALFAGSGAGHPRLLRLQPAVRAVLRRHRHHLARDGHREVDLVHHRLHDHLRVVRGIDVLPVRRLAYRRDRLQRVDGRGIVVLAGMLFQIFRPMPTFDKKKDKVAGELEAEGSVA